MVKFRMCLKLVKLLLLLKLVLLWKNSSMKVKVIVCVMMEKYMFLMCEWNVKQLNMKVKKFGISIISSMENQKWLVIYQYQGQVFQFRNIMKFGRLFWYMLLWLMVCIRYMLWVYLFSVKKMLCFSERMFVQFYIRLRVSVVMVQYMNFLIKVMVQEDMCSVLFVGNSRLQIGSSVSMMVQMMMLVQDG